MTDFVRIFSFYAPLIVLPILGIISVIFYRKQKTKGKLLFSIGMILMNVGSFVQLFIPYAAVYLNEAGEIESFNGVPLSWHLGCFLFSLGIIVAVIGFSLITFKETK